MNPGKLYSKRKEYLIMYQTLYMAWEDLNWILEENRGRHTAASDWMNSLFKSLGDRE